MGCCFAGVIKADVADIPGCYRIAKDGTLVTEGQVVDSAELGKLSKGAIVHVMEVVIKQGRTRGRIASPPGWISLVNRSAGQRWANREVADPGRYVVMSPTAVTEAASVDSADITQLPGGKVFEVVEVVVQEERIRGRIAEPAGWVSLTKMSTGERWATMTEAASNVPLGEEIPETTALAVLLAQVREEFEALRREFHMTSEQIVSASRVDLQNSRFTSELDNQCRLIDGMLQRSRAGVDKSETALAVKFGCFAGCNKEARAADDRHKELAAAVQSFKAEATEYTASFAELRTVATWREQAAKNSTTGFDSNASKPGALLYLPSQQ